MLFLYIGIMTQLDRSMKFNGRALYNILRMNWLNDSVLEVQSWQVEDYQLLSEEDLFHRLEKFDIFLQKENFILYSEECDSPEDLTDCFVTSDEEAETHDQVYLLVFEAWRRYYPQRQSLSVFCDQLDLVIHEYEKEELENDETLQAMLKNFENILDQHVDGGGDPREGFTYITTYCCHDLESFLYEFISTQIEEENDLYASELLEGFYPYLEDQTWFDFLRVRLVSLTVLDEAYIMLDRLLETLEEKPDLGLLSEILRVLVYKGETEQFHTAFDQALELLETESDFLELLIIGSDYLGSNDKKEDEQTLRALIKAQKGKNLEDELDRDQKPYRTLKETVTYTVA